MDEGRRSEEPKSGRRKSEEEARDEGRKGEETKSRAQSAKIGSFEGTKIGGTREN